jgi:hypothetical protein
MPFKNASNKIINTTNSKTRNIILMDELKCHLKMHQIKSSNQGEK